MAMAVVTVASGGMAVVDETITVSPSIGHAVTEALNGKGMAVTKVAKGGMPVKYIVVKTDGTPHPK